MPMDSIRFSLFPDGWPQGLASAWNEGMTRIVGGGVLSLCLLLAGCSQETGPTEKVDKMKKSAVSEGVVEAVPSAESSVSNKAIVNEGDSKETVSQWSAVIKSQWKEIATALLNGNEAATLPDSLQLPVQMFDSETLQSKELHHGRSVRVTEVRVPETGKTIQATPQAFVADLRERLSIIEIDAQNSVHLKLFSINRDGETLKTRQRLTAKGLIGKKPAHSSAVVDAIWQLPSSAAESAVPRLIEWSMPLLMRNELSSDEKVSFDDITGSILGGNASWNEQLQIGMNTWRRQIERSLNPDFLGYHGLAVGDVNGDGLEDLYVCQPGGLPNLLFKQEQDGTLVDISADARVDWLDNTTGSLLVDLDNDGDADLALATRTAFLIMENDGKGKFSLVERLTNLGMGYSPSAADYDLDGDLDLLVLRYAADGKVGDFPTPHPFHSARNGGANVLLQNQGGLSFLDVTDETGLGVENYRFSFAASWEDYDNDGDVDLYIANDFGPNQLFRSEGEYFVDESSESGSQDWGFGMSATWADYDRDGFMDLYVSSMFSGAGNQVVAQSDFNANMPEETRSRYLKMVRGNTLLKNSGQGQFEDLTSPMAEGFGGWAWGAKFADFNNDGWEDLYVANGYISQPDTDDL